MGMSNIVARFLTADTDALDADSVCQSQSAGAAGNLTINGAKASGGVATFSAARLITVASTGNLATLTFTITGTDINGSALVEVVTGVNNNTVTTVGYFKTITQVAISGSTAGENVIVGMNASALDVIFAGSIRIKGVYVVFSGTAGTMDFVKGSAAGASVLKFGTVNAATSVDSIHIPEEGIRSENGSYLKYTVATFANITVFSA
jgi:VCBS repeat-containing protein